MNSAWGLGLWLLLFASAEEPVQVRLWVEPQVAFVGEPVRVVAELWVREDALAGNLVQLSAGRLDVPVDWAPPLGAELVGLEFHRPPSDRDGGPSGAIHGRRTNLGPARREVRESETWLGWERTFEVVAPKPGDWSMQAGAKYAVTSGFERTLFGDLRPLDRREREARAALTELKVVPLPAEGQPADFAGAVGEFSLLARWIRGPDSETQPAEFWTLEVELSGTGNLARLEPPRFAIPHLHPLGWIELGPAEERHQRRQFHYEWELAPPGGARFAGLEARSLAYPYLAPGRDGTSPRYQVAQSAEIPVPNFQMQRDATRPGWLWPILALAGAGLGIAIWRWRFSRASPRP